MSIEEDLLNEIKGLKSKVSALDSVEVAPSGHSTDNTANPPTAAQLDTAFGTPAAMGAGFIGTLDDNGAGTAVYLIVGDGANWWHTLMTKAV